MQLAAAKYQPPCSRNPAVTAAIWLAAWLTMFPALQSAPAREVIFAVRQPRGPHWYENFGYSVVDPDKKLYGTGGRLCRWNMETGELNVLLDDPEGAVRDPQVHYDGQRILFSYRPGGTRSC